MRRFVIGCSVAALSLLGGAFASMTEVGATTMSPMSPPIPTEVHPIVGAWVLTDLAFPDDPPSLTVFHADGTFGESDPDGSTGIGSWQATGPSSFALTFVSMSSNGDGTFSPNLTIRAVGEVAADGTFTAQFTIELVGEGLPPGEWGPGTVTGTRISVEPMGTPAGSLDDLAALFGGPPGSEPAGSEPAGSEPAGSQPAGSQPAGSEPTGSEPTGSEPTGSEPTGSEPTGSEPTGSEPTGSEPTGSEPTGSEPTGSEPTGSEPTGSEPMATAPETSA